LVSGRAGRPAKYLHKSFPNILFSSKYRKKSRGNWLNQVHLNNISAVAEMGNRLATTDMGQKLGAALPLSVGEGELGTI